MTALLNLTLTELEQTEVISVEGEMDASTVPRLRACVREASTTRLLVLDLSDVTFCDSAGLGLLVGVHKQRPAGMTRLVITSPRILRLLHMTGLQGLFDVRSSLEDATA